MKPLFLLCALALASETMAAPAPKKVVWEYATVDLETTQMTTATTFKRGVKLFLPGGKVVFLESANRNTPEYRNYLLNRLGAQGWELTAVSGTQGSEHRYILKRQK